MEGNKMAHNHWLLIEEAQKSGVFQFAVSNEDSCNGNSKLSNPPSLIPSNYCR